MSRCLSRALCAIAVCSLFPAVELLAQSPRVQNPTLTINIARRERAGADPRNPGSVVSAVSLTPDGRVVAAVGDDHVVRTYELASGRNLQNLAGHQRWVRGAAFSADGQTLVTAGEDRKLIFWDQHANRLVRELNTHLQVYGLAHSPAGDRFAIVGFGDRVRLFTAAGELAAELTCPCRDMRAVTFSPDGSMLAGGGRDGKVVLWQLNGRGPADQNPLAPAIDHRNEPGRIIGAHRRAVHAAIFSADGQWLATAGDGDVIRIWNVRTGTERLWIPKQAKTRSLCFCGDNFLAEGGTSNRINIWDLSRVEQLFAQKKLHRETPLDPDIQLVGHEGSVTSLAYDARNGVLVSGSFDTTVRTWSVKPGAPRTAVGDGKIR
jgi:WD40 repeat protein